MMRWGYKTVHFELKKEGLLGGSFLDETEIEQELNEFGTSGWELVSVLEVQDGIIAFFKQPLTIKGSFRDRQEQVERDDDDHHERDRFAVPGEPAEPLETVREARENEAADDGGIGTIRIE